MFFYMKTSYYSSCIYRLLVLTVLKLHLVHSWTLLLTNAIKSGCVFTM
ncbi:unnamed protein product [Callosobruchus maculatus]|uniref:Uncharacterized protein n=1 Tax=Callosobruchus maculatus TaxID=64391 RepID=A0A653D7Z1_CALMS|nr:unnamed protein product [Callosobruchus maculatus]